MHPSSLRATQVLHNLVRSIPFSISPIRFGFHPQRLEQWAKTCWRTITAETFAKLVDTHISNLANRRPADGYSDRRTVGTSEISDNTPSASDQSASPDSGLGTA